MRSPRKRATFLMIAALGGMTARLSREASAAEPTISECLTAYEDSVSLRRNNQLRAARAKLVTCSARSCPAEIQAECIGRVRDIDTSMPTVVFEARDATGTSLLAVTVKMDGNVLTERLQGSALPIDPGEHTFTFEVVGRPSVEKHLLILEGEKLRRERVEFEAIAPAKPPAPPPVAVAKSEVLERPQPVPEAKPGLGKARTAALVLGGIGVAATGLGVAYGLVAMSRRDEANNVCPMPQCPTQHGVDLWSDTRSAANISTGAFIVGAAGIASGLVIWLRAKPTTDAAPSPQISLGPGGFQLQGQW